MDLTGFGPEFRALEERLEAGTTQLSVYRAIGDRAMNAVSAEVAEALDGKGLNFVMRHNYTLFGWELSRLLRTMPGRRLAENLAILVRKWAMTGLDPELLESLAVRVCEKLEVHDEAPQT